MDPVHHGLPVGQAVHFSFKAKVTADNGIQPMAVQHQRCLIQAVHGIVLDDAVLLDVAEQGNLVLYALLQRPVHPRHDDVRMDAQGLQLLDRMLGRFGFELVGAAEVRHQCHMDEQAVSRLLQRDLADRLDEGLAFDVTDGAADLGDQDICARAFRTFIYEILDLIGHMGNDLDRLPQVFALPLPVQHVPVDLAAGQIGVAGQVLVDKPLVMPKIQIGLRAVIGHKYLAVLKGAHRSRIHIHVGIQLL